MAAIIDDTRWPEYETRGQRDWKRRRRRRLTYLSDDSLSVDDEETAQRVAQVLEIDAVVLGYLVRDVREERNVDVAKAALVTWRVHPGQMGELTVRGDGHDLGVELTELVGTVAEGDDLGGTDEGEIERVEE